MANVWFIGCAHLGHKNIDEFQPERGGNSDELILNFWASHVKKKDIVWCLGDVAFTDEALLKLGELPGRKKLVSGNHEDLTSQDIQHVVFEEVRGMVRYKRMWLTHAPLHPQVVDEARCHTNVHAHTHSDTPEDPRYFSVDVGVLIKKFGCPMIDLNQLRSNLNND